MSERFIDNQNGTITDNETGLMWQQETLEMMPHDKAILACSKLDIAGHKDWRLPTIAELLTIVDFERHSPACNPVFKTQSNYYWSSSTSQNFPTYAWYVYFSNGLTGPNGKTAGYYVRAVRAGSCPRRDYITKSDLRRVLEAMDNVPRGVRACAAGLATLAALDALAPEPAKACAGFVCCLPQCGFSRDVKCCWNHHACDDCGKQFSAHQQEQAQQPAPAALPTMIDSIEANFLWVRKSVFEAYQRECERLRGETACDACCGTGMALSGPCGCGGTRKLRDMVTHLRQLLYTTEQRAEQLQQHRDAAADAEFAATQRAEQAENLRDMMVEKCSHAGIVRERLEDKLEQAERERDEARAELAGLRVQEPVPEYPSSEGYAGDHVVYVYQSRRPVLYASPVPPSDSISPAQHEAVVEALKGQVAEARWEERERCAVEANRWSPFAAEKIRALPDVEMWK